MQCERWALGAILLLAGSSVSPYNWSEPNLSASASMRIALKVPAQVSLNQTLNPEFDELCMKRIPASNYRIYVRDIGAPPSADTQFTGSHRNLCVPVSSSAAGKLVFIVAE